MGALVLAIGLNRPLSKFFYHKIKLKVKFWILNIVFSGYFVKDSKRFYFLDSVQLLETKKETVT